MNVIHDLIASLHGSDAEGSEVAFRLKSITGGRDLDPSAPPWHPSHPDHPLRDAWQDEGHAMFSPSGEWGGKHVLNDRAAATAAARHVIDTEVHPSHRQFFHDILSAKPSMSSVSHISPVHPDNPAHNAYLANPSMYHYNGFHDKPMMASDLVYLAHNRHMSSAARDPNHPLNPSHPDHMALMDAHANNHFDIGPLLEPYTHRGYYDHPLRDL